MPVWQSRLPFILPALSEGPVLYAASLQIVGALPNLAHPSTRQLHLNLLDQFGGLLAIDSAGMVWESSAPAVATIDATGLVATVAAGSFTVTARWFHVPPVTSAGITVTNPAPALVAIGIVEPVISGGVGLAFTVLVDLLDAGGARITTRTDNVSIAHQAGPGGMTGGGVVAAVAGRATFTIALDTADPAHILRATSGVLTDDSVAFTVPAVAASPNKPGDIGTLVMAKAWNTLPPASPAKDADGFQFLSAGARCTIIPIIGGVRGGGFALRYYFPPTQGGGGSPDDFLVVFTAAPHSLPAAQLKNLYEHMGFRAGPPGFFNVSGNSGYKFCFDDQHDGHNGYENLGLSNFMNWNSQGVPVSFNYNLTPSLGLSAVLDGLWHRIEKVKRANTLDTALAPGGNGSYELFLDGVSKGTRTGITVDKIAAKAFFDRKRFSSTAGGGFNNPPGVRGAGSNGKFIRNDGVAGTVAGNVFTRSAGTFNTSGNVGDAARSWCFVKPDGTVVGPLSITASLRTASTLTAPSGSPSIAGCTVAYPTHEPFDPATTPGKTLWLRSGVLNRRANAAAMTGSEDGEYPLTLNPVAVAVTTTTTPNDTVTFAGDATGADWLFGLLSALQTTAEYWEMEFLDVYHG